MAGRAWGVPPALPCLRRARRGRRPEARPREACCGWETGVSRERRPPGWPSLRGQASGPARTLLCVRVRCSSSLFGSDGRGWAGGPQGPTRSSVGVPQGWEPATARPPPPQQALRPLGLPVMSAKELPGPGSWGGPGTPASTCTAPRAARLGWLWTLYGVGLVPGLSVVRCVRGAARVVYGVSTVPGAAWARNSVCLLYGVLKIPVCPRCPVISGVGMVPDAHVLPVLRVQCVSAGSPRGRCYVVSEWYLVWARDTQCYMQCPRESGPCTYEVSELKAGGQVAFSVWVSERWMASSDSEVRSWVLPSTSPRCSASYCGPCPWRQEPAETSSVRRKAESKHLFYF